MDDSQIESDAADLLEPDSGEPDIQVTAPYTKICCNDSRIYQPQDSSLLKKTEKAYGSGKNACKRHLNPAWFKSCSWLHFCLTSMKVYWHYCKRASALNISVMSTKAASIFCCFKACAN